MSQSYQIYKSLSNIIYNLLSPLKLLDVIICIRISDIYKTECKNLILLTYTCSLKVGVFWVIGALLTPSGELVRWLLTVPIRVAKKQSNGGACHHHHW